MDDREEENKIRGLVSLHSENHLGYHLGLLLGVSATLPLQFTIKIPIETMGSPTIKEIVNSSLRRSVPKRTPKIGVKKVKAESRLTE